MQQEPRAAGFGVWVVCENANEGSLLPAVRKKRRSDVIAMQRANPLNRLRFGIFEADPRIGELTKHGKRLPLQEQPFQPVSYTHLDVYKRQAVAVQLHCRAIRQRDGGLLPNGSLEPRLRCEAGGIESCEKGDSDRYGGRGKSPAPWALTDFGRLMH